MFGVGALALPASFARLGWLPAVFVVLLMYAQTVLLAQLFKLLIIACPSARVCSHNALNLAVNEIRFYPSNCRLAGIDC